MVDRTEQANANRGRTIPVKALTDLIHRLREMRASIDGTAVIWNLHVVQYWSCQCD